MAKFSFGVTQEDIEKQEAAELRAQEAIIQKRTQERNLKLQKLNKKYKRNRILLILLFILFFIGMLVFGTYNTFFKQTLDENQITEIINKRMTTFYTYGVEGFLHNSVGPYFENNASIINSEEEEGKGIEKFELDPNSVRVTRIGIIAPDAAIVYFNANVTVKLQDGYKDDHGKRVPYVGETFYNEYQFRVVLGYHDNAYSYESALEIQPQLLKDNYNFEEIEESQYLDFEKLEIEELDDDDQVEAIKIKVDRILADLYAGKDTGSDSDTNKFNTNDEYLGITEFKYYTKDNALGYNAYCEYQIRTIDKLTYTNAVYMKISPNGKNSWKIEKFL